MGLFPSTADPLGLSSPLLSEQKISQVVRAPNGDAWIEAKPRIFLGGNFCVTETKHLGKVGAAYI